MNIFLSQHILVPVKSHGISTGAFLGTAVTHNFIVSDASNAYQGKSIRILSLPLMCESIAQLAHDVQIALGNSLKVTKLTEHNAGVEL